MSFPIRPHSSLAIGLGVSVVAALHLPLAREGGLGNLGIDRVVLPRHARHGLLQHGKVHVTLVTILGLTLVTILGLTLVTILGLPLVTVLGLPLVTVLGLPLVTILGLTAATAVAICWLLVLRGEGVAKVGVVALGSNSMTKC